MIKRKLKTKQEQREYVLQVATENGIDVSEYGEFCLTKKFTDYKSKKESINLYKSTIDKNPLILLVSNIKDGEISYDKPELVNIKNINTEEHSSIKDMFTCYNFTYLELKKLEIKQVIKNSEEKTTESLNAKDLACILLHLPESDKQWLNNLINLKLSK